MTIETIVVGQMAANCYIVVDHGEALIIDPGDDAEYIIDKLTHLAANPTLIVATHGHFDHIMAARTLQLAYRIPFAIHPDDIFLLKQMRDSARHYLGITTDPPPKVAKKLKDEETLKIGSKILKVFHVPGHTPGSICLTLASEKILFVGDTIFAGGIVGRTDFSYANKKDLERSLRRILDFPSKTKLLPGHGESFTTELWQSQ